MNDSSLFYARSSYVAIALSVLLHVAFGIGLSLEILNPKREIVILEPEPATEQVRFELVDTPDSATVEEPPEDSRLISSQNTQAQQPEPAQETERETPKVAAQAPGYDLRPERAAPPVVQPAPPEPVTPPAPPDVTSIEAPAPAQEPNQPAEQVEEAKPPEPKPEEATQQRESRVQLVEAPPVEAEPEPEPVRIAMNTPPPAPEIVQLPRKEKTQHQREVARLRQQMQAMKDANRIREGRLTITAAEADALAGATAEGEFSFAASEHYFADYMLEMRSAVEAQWVSLLHTEYTRPRRSYVEVDFKVFADGSVKIFGVPNQEGDDFFPGLCIRAIKDAAPFGEVPYDSSSGVPASLEGKPLNIRFTFRYN